MRAAVRRIVKQMPMARSVNASMVNCWKAAAAAAAAAAAESGSVDAICRGGQSAVGGKTTNVMPFREEGGTVKALKEKRGQ
jgi:hypothetical protein